MDATWQATILSGPLLVVASRTLIRRWFAHRESGRFSTEEARAISLAQGEDVAGQGAIYRTVGMVLLWRPVLAVFSLAREKWLQDVGLLGASFGLVLARLVLLDTLRHEVVREGPDQTSA